MATTADLMQDVYARFTTAYAAEVAVGAAAIAFEPFGLMPGIDPSSTSASTAALEYLSVNADFLPRLGGASYMATEQTASTTYKIMLGLAQPLPTANLSVFNALKAAASELLQNGATGSALGAYTYYPAFASPPDWFNTASPSIWTSYGYTATLATPPPVAPPTPRPPFPRAPIPHIPVLEPPGPRPPIHLMDAPSWQLTAHAGAAAAVPLTIAHPTVTAAPSAISHPFLPSTRVFLPTVHPIWVGPAVPAVPTSTPPLLHPDFSLSFDYCVVQLRRPWLSGDFLTATGWFVPGAKAGDLACGQVPASASLASDGSPGGDKPASDPSVPPTSPLSWLPVACIAIKNLNITIGAGLDATPASHATAFGPFALRPVTPAGGASDTDRLTNPGVQIVAWICVAQPVLPPATDPGLVPTTSAGTTAATG